MRIERQLTAFLDEEADLQYRMEKTAKNHLRVVLEKGDQREVVICGGTPSDHRSFLNTRAEIRRRIRKLNGEAGASPAPVAKRAKPMRRRATQPSVADRLQTEAPAKRKNFALPAPERTVKAHRWIMKKEQPLLTRNEMADRLGVHPVRISQLVSSGCLEGAYEGEGRKRRFKPDLVVQRYKAGPGWYRDDLS